MEFTTWIITLLLRTSERRPQRVTLQTYIERLKTEQKNSRYILSSSTKNNETT